MPERRQPLALCGENPAMTLYQPGSEQIVAVAGYWRCIYSPYGVGQVVLVWVDPTVSGLGTAAPHAIYSDNLPLADYIVQTFNQHFPEFRGYSFGDFSAEPGQIAQEAADTNGLRVTCQADERTLVLTWGDVLHRSLLLYPGFPCGGQLFDLSTVLCPCGAASLRIDGQLLAGEVRTEQSGAVPHSSAFLAFCETWIGPVPV